MTERFLTFAQVQQTLGMSADEVRDLMESRALVGRLMDGVVKFPESQVLAVHGGAAPKPGAPEADAMALQFLVDEDEEEKIEGRRYEGEDLLKGDDASLLAPDEEIMEPVDLSDDQLASMELLGGAGAVEYGREVAERGTDARRPDDDDDIFDVSEIELPEIEPVLGERVFFESEKKEEVLDASQIELPEEVIPPPRAEEPAVETPAPEEAAPLGEPELEEAARIEVEPPGAMEEAAAPAGAPTEDTVEAEAEGPEPVAAEEPIDLSAELDETPAEAPEPAIAIEPEPEPVSAEIVEEEPVRAEVVDEEAEEEIPPVPAAPEPGVDGKRQFAFVAEETAPTPEPQAAEEIAPEAEPAEAKIVEEQPLVEPEPIAEEASAVTAESVEASFESEPPAEEAAPVEAEAVESEEPPVLALDVTPDAELEFVAEAIEPAQEEERPVEAEPAQEEVATEAGPEPEAGPDEATEEIEEVAAQSVEAIEEEAPPEPEPVETIEEIEAAEQPGFETLEAAEDVGEPFGPEEKIIESFEVEKPLPVAEVTRDVERAVDEEIEERPEPVEETPAVLEEIEQLEEIQPSEEMPAAMEEQGVPIDEAVEIEERGAAEIVEPIEEAEAEPAEAAEEIEAIEEVAGTAEPEMPIEPFAAAAAFIASDNAGEPEAGNAFDGIEEELAAEEADASTTLEKQQEEEPAWREPQRASRFGTEEEKPVADEKKDEGIPSDEEESLPLSDFDLDEDVKRAGKKSDDEFELFDLDEGGTAAPQAEGETLEDLEEIETLEEEPASAGARSLEDEMAELFGETAEKAPDAAFAEPAAKVDEDFDLSVFQTETEAPASAEALFEPGEIAAPVPEQPVAAPEAEGVSRIRALTEERAQPSNALVTVLVVLTFLAVTFGGMLLWHLSKGR